MTQNCTSCPLSGELILCKNAQYNYISDRGVNELSNAVRAYSSFDEGVGLENCIVWFSRLSCFPRNTGSGRDFERGCHLCSDGVRVRFRVRFQAVKVQIFGEFLVENPTKANHLKALLRGISLAEYGSEGFRVRLRGLSEYGSIAYFVERPTRETQAEQYSDTVLYVSRGNELSAKRTTKLHK